MIKTLEIRNFQSHKETKLEFDPGVNIIMGTSDSGKTAIIRALRWAIENRPLGDSIRSTWGGETKVHLKTDSCSVVRIKDKRDEYLLGDKNNANFTMFKAFGTTVPEEIQKALDLDSVNSQFQLDPPFLFSKTSGEISAYFNRIANLSILDKTRSAIERNISALESGIKYNSAQLVGKEKELPNFDYLEKFEIELEVQESLESERNALSSQMSRLSQLLESYSETLIDLEAKKETLKYESEIDSILNLIGIRKETDDEIENLTELLNSISITTGSIYQKTKSIKAEKEVNAIIDLLQEENKSDENITNLKSFLYNIQKTEQMLHVQKISVKELQKTFMEEMPDICPLCNSPVNHKH